jgi:hypothetical protein
MIPYADLERAIARWKARQSGQDVSVPAHEHEVGDEHVVGEAYTEAGPTEVVEGASGLITIHEETTKH